MGYITLGYNPLTKLLLTSWDFQEPLYDSWLWYEPCYGGSTPTALKVQQFNSSSKVFEVITGVTGCNSYEWPKKK